LRTAKLWKSGRDAEQAAVLFNGFRERIDLEYLEKRAREERVDGILPKVGESNP